MNAVKCLIVTLTLVPMIAGPAVAAPIADFRQIAPNQVARFDVPASGTVNLVGNNMKANEKIRVWIGQTSYMLTGRGSLTLQNVPARTTILLDNRGNWLPFTVEITVLTN